MVDGPRGWPEYVFRAECAQVVGVRAWWDLLNIRRSYCPLRGHREDVMRQSQAAELRERVRHEVERPPSNDPLELLSVRPEMRGVYR